MIKSLGKFKNFYRTSIILLSFLLVQVEITSLAEQIAIQIDQPDETGSTDQTKEANKITETQSNVNPEPANLYMPKNFEQAKTIIALAENRKFIKLESAAEVKEFEFLIVANVLAKIIEAKDLFNFKKWFNKNRIELNTQAPKMGEQLNWQIFLLNIYIKFKTEKSAKDKNSTSVSEWMHSVIVNPLVKQVSEATFGMLTGVFGFVTGVLYGAMVSGPAAGFINAFLEPLLRPLREKSVVFGIKLFGKTGKAINSAMFDGQASENLAEEMNNTKKTIKDVRTLIAPDSYVFTPEQWVDNLQNLYKSWNHLNYVWNKMPDAYKGGRDRMTEQLIFRPREFANSVTQAITAAEVHRQGAEQMLDRILQKTTDVNLAEITAENLYLKIEEQMRSTSAKLPAKRKAELKAEQVQLEQDLINLGATTKQVDRIVENYTRIFIFTRQAATVLGGQILHDTEFSDTISQARGSFEVMRTGNCLQFFHRELAEEVKNVLDRLNFEIDLSLKFLEKNTPAAGATLDIITKTNASKEAQHILTEPDSLTQSLEEESQNTDKAIKNKSDKAIKRAIKGAERK